MRYSVFSGTMVRKREPRLEPGTPKRRNLESRPRSVCLVENRVGNVINKSSRLAWFVRKWPNDSWTGWKLTARYPESLYVLRVNLLSVNHLRANNVNKKGRHS